MPRFSCVGRGEILELLGAEHFLSLNLTLEPYVTKIQYLANLSHITVVPPTSQQGGVLRDQNIGSSQPAFTPYRTPATHQSSVTGHCSTRKQSTVVTSTMTPCSIDATTLALHTVGWAQESGDVKSSAHAYSADTASASLGGVTKKDAPISYEANNSFSPSTGNPAEDCVEAVKAGTKETARYLKQLPNGLQLVGELLVVLLEPCNRACSALLIVLLKAALAPFFR